MKDSADIVGQMRHRISFLDLTKTVDSDYGGMRLTGTTTIGPVWASWEAKTGGSGEQVDSGQQDAVTSVVFRIRYRTDVKEDMLISYESKYYDILSLLPDSRRCYLTIEARQRGDGWNPTAT